MAKPEWGLKRTCLSCGARFYDMQRDPIVCPTCETEFDPLALVRPRRARAAAASQAKAKAEAEKKPAEETAEESGDDLLANDDLDTDTVSAMTYALVVEKADPAEFAANWVAENSDRVDGWLQ